jgi:hypothetical protein
VVEVCGVGSTAAQIELGCNMRKQKFAATFLM